MTRVAAPSGPAHEAADEWRFMRINVLGPIEVIGGALPLPLVGQRQRALLAALTLDLGKVVPVDRLIDVLWDTSPPPTARAKIQAHVSALRQAIGHDARESDGLLLTIAPGYLLRRELVELDLAEFDSLTAEASRSGQPGIASSLLAAALALWRGSPFADVTSPAIRNAGEKIAERRMLAVEAKAGADITLGRCDEVVAELSPWLAVHPFRERMRAMLMIALYRLGCRADALTLYRDGHQAMVAELGLEPGPQLRDLQWRILVDDPALLSAARPLARA
ncbi:MAG: AfsR/SARP family transcriptional regulator [Streptosporangiaceae bacterium]|nr:AfsR/SARP family transcriptional regulator [Streptosporangiaceae bacterium]